MSGDITYTAYIIDLSLCLSNLNSSFTIYTIIIGGYIIYAYETQLLLFSRRRRAKELDNVVVKSKGQEVTWSD